MRHPLSLLLTAAVALTLCALLGAQRPAPAPKLTIILHDGGDTPGARTGDGVAYYAGDANLDGVRDVRDAKPFTLACDHPRDYRRRYGVPGNVIADIDGDGRVTFSDKAAFERATR